MMGNKPQVHAPDASGAVKSSSQHRRSVGKHEANYQSVPKNRDVHESEGDEEISDAAPESDMDASIKKPSPRSQMQKLSKEKKDMEFKSGKTQKIKDAANKKKEFFGDASDDKHEGDSPSYRDSEHSHAEGQEDDYEE